MKIRCHRLFALAAIACATFCLPLAAQTSAAAIGNTRADAPRSGACIHRVISGESFTGMVFGIAHTLVNPPAAPAAVPVAIVSL